TIERIVPPTTRNSSVPWASRPAIVVRSAAAPIPTAVDAVRSQPRSRVRAVAAGATACGSTSFHFIPEWAEQVVRVVRAGGGQGMVPHAEDRPGLVPQPLDRAVVQVDVRPLHVRRQALGIDREPVILRGDLDLAGLQLLDRMVPAAMAEL